MKIFKTQNAPNRSDRPARSGARPGFITQIVLWSVLLVGIAGTTGLGVVWQRQLIAETANRIKHLEARLAEIERRQTGLYSELAAEQSLDALTSRNERFALGLVAIREQQLVRVNTASGRAIATRRTAEILDDAASARITQVAR